jgi:formylglycine-generating enzyme required for sulfatase activity
MEVWRPLAEELRAILASSQAFRAVELRRFDPSSNGLEVEGWNQEASVVLLLSDAASAHWWDGRMFSHLEQWARQAPVALLNMLPIHWWARTALGIAPLVSLSNSQPGSANLCYRAQPLNRWQDLDPSGEVPLPVITLEAEELAIWAAMAMGDGEVAISGILIPEDRAEEGATPSTDEVAEEGATLSTDEVAWESAGVGPKKGERSKRLKAFLLPPEEAGPADLDVDRELASRRWKEFQGDASAQAQRLLMVMAAAPVLTLPIIRLLLEAKVKDATNPLPMAEVLVSGLLRCRPASDPTISHQRLQLELEPGVASLLRERLSPGDTLDVIRAVTAVIERRWNSKGNGHSFEAILTDPSLPLPEGMEGVLHFATVTADLLEQLPGNAYRKFAAKLREGARRKTADPFPPEQFRFEAIDVPCARLVCTPELVDPCFTSACLVELPSHRFDFETAWIDPGRSEVQSKVANRPGFQEWLLVPPAPEAKSNIGAPPLPVGPVVLDMLHIPSGHFQMGSPPEERERYSEEGPQHEVLLREFFLARTPITQVQWRAVAEWQRQEQEEEALWPAELDPDPVDGLERAERFRGQDKPVVNVSWRQAMAFCQRLRLRTGKNYTLPSEAQWEYACRAGTTTAFHFGETITSELANYDASYTYANGSKGEDRQQTTSVGMFPANAWGLQDMHGNVWEWCLDHWHHSYEGAPTDGSAWVDGEGLNGEENSERRRLLRGGSWLRAPRNCRSAYRDWDHPGGRVNYRGFRVCCLPQDLILYP